MTHRVTEAVRDEELAALLAGHPRSWVVAIGDDGFFVPMPASVPLSGQRVLDGPICALDIVVPEDRVAVVEIWEQAQNAGYGQVTVHMSVAPSQPVQMHFVDVRHAYGVYLGVVVTEQEPRGGSPSQPVFLPRVGFVRKDRLGLFVEVDDAVCAILGWQRDELIGRRSLTIIHPDDQQRAIGHWMDMLTSPSGARQRARLRHQHRDGHWLWFEVTNHNRLDDPDHGYVLSEMVDISEEMAAQEALRANAQLLRTLTESLPVGVLQVDAARQVVHHNRRLVEILGGVDGGWSRGGPSGGGLGGGGLSGGGDLDEWLAAVRQDDRAALDEALENALRHGKDAEIEVVLDGAGGDVGGTRRCGVAVRPLYGSDPGQIRGALVCVSDVTEAVRLREELTDRATRDALTRTLNRAETIATLERALRDPGRGVGVVFVDLDGFKEVNDRRGHAVGDRLLAHVAGRLAATARQGDVVGRLGGDEFLVVCHDVAGPADALEIGVRLAASLRQPTDVDGQPLVPRASLGVSWSGAGSITADGLIARADMAMYESKSARTGTPVLR